jgi:hypothetical protein
MYNNSSTSSVSNQKGNLTANQNPSPQKEKTRKKGQPN